MNYLKVATEIATLLHEKNAAYGDAINRTTQIMEILFPDGFAVKRLKFVLIIVRIIDKLCREATNSDIENWKDIAGYALRVVAEMEQELLKQAYESPYVDIDGFSSTDKARGCVAEVKYTSDSEFSCTHVCSFYSFKGNSGFCVYCGAEEPK
jgi:hypothetical protein